MRWFGWFRKRDDDDDEAPDTLREGQMSMEDRWRSVDVRLTQIELILQDISKALVSQGYTLKGHLRSHDEEGRRLRLATPPGDEA